MNLPEIDIPHPWYCLLSCLVVTTVCSFVMKGQAKRFRYLRGIAITSFSMMDLEFPGSPGAVAHIVQGIDRLSPEEARKSRAALKANLWWDFLFMAGLYPAIFLLCWLTAMKMEHAGRIIFLILAWLQIVPLLCDILENAYLLSKMKHPFPARQNIHRAYIRMVSTKWIIASSGGVCAIFGLLYFWLNGVYGNGFLNIGIGLICIVAVLIGLAAFKLAKAVIE